MPLAHVEQVLGRLNHCRLQEGTRSKILGFHVRVLLLLALGSDVRKACRPLYMVLEALTILDPQDVGVTVVLLVGDLQFVHYSFVGLKMLGL